MSLPHTLPPGYVASGKGGRITPEQFIRKWTAILQPEPPEGATERTYLQENFIDLCRLLGHKTPAEGDPERYRFEKPLGLAVDR